MMKILIIPSWYKTETNPYSGTFFEEQARMLQKYGNKVSVLFPNHIPSFKAFVYKPSFNHKIVSDNRLTIYYSNTKSILPSRYAYFFNINFIVKRAIKLFEIYCEKEGRPDIIHAHSLFYGGIVAMEISQKYNIPFVITEHLSSLINSNEFDKKPFKNYLNRVYEKSSKNIFVSNFFKTKIIDKYHVDSTKSLTIYNLVNKIFFEEIKQNHIKKKVFKIINIGGLISRKNQSALIQAVAILNRQGVNVELTIIGKGELKSYLIQLVNKLAISKNVKIIEGEDRQGIKSRISESHILVSTSLFETFGLNIAEAIAVGRPVVAFNAGGPKEIINQNNGIVVYNNKPQDFADAILAIYNNYDKFDSNKISDECYAKFSEEIIYKDLLKVYNEIVR